MDRNSRNPYDDIIHLSQPVSTKHPQMSLSDRAAQFAPFAALTGYGEAVTETARLTDQKIELDESEIEIINHKIHLLMDHFELSPVVTITYFVPDERKEGGEYRSVRGTVKKINEYEKTIIMTDSTEIPFDDILDISGEHFPEF